MTTAVGTWSAIVELPHRVRAVELSFRPDGIAVVRTDADAIAGTGTWSSTGADRFAYELVELMPGGCVVVRQDGRLDAGSFSGSGTTDVFDEDGHLVRSTPARVTAVRVAVGASSCAS